MPILGNAIAAHLSRLEGLYSVELPGSLINELGQLVTSCNASSTPNRALLVTDDTPPSGVASTLWAEILKWRTNDDRVFAWKRGSREPDTSFTSVVRPFISSRFPGSPSGECTLELFAELSIKELWRRNFPGLPGASFDAFVETAKWVAGVLRYAFEQEGLTPSKHWSDSFLEHWAKMLEQLDENLSNLGTTPNPRHAWEIVRVAGLPIPSKIASTGNALMNPPGVLDERDWPALADFWQEIVDEFVLSPGAIAVLLAALDKRVIGSGGVSPWRGLNWDGVNRLPAGTASPLVGQIVFTSSPTLLSGNIPGFPAPVPSWWGVASDDLKWAVDQLKGVSPLEPVPGNAALLEAYPGQGGTYILNTRTASPANANTAKTWKTRIQLNQLQLTYREGWRSLTVSSLEPTSPSEGDAWIKPDATAGKLPLDVKGKGAKIVRADLSKGGAGQLLIECDVLIEYTAALDSTKGTFEGKWPVLRELRLSTLVRDYVGGKWGPERFIDTSVELVIPSPFSVTVLIFGKKIFYAPGNGVNFSTSLGSSVDWEPERDPSILLPEEGTYWVSIYDGRILPSGASFAPVSSPSINGKPLPTHQTILWQSYLKERLDEGDTITAEDSGGVSRSAAVISIKERSGNKSSGLLSAVSGLPAAQKPPSTQARTSFLGQFQVNLANAMSRLTGGTFNSLYQYVISSTGKLDGWPDHDGTPAPVFSTDLQTGLILPGIGNGPSTALVSSHEWSKFMQALTEVCGKAGLKPGSSEFWISGFDPSELGADVVRSYVLAHRDMVQAAKGLSPRDEFWASYPFSVCIVEGSSGATFGQLLALLLSPMHPARLAWSFAVAFTARASQGDRSLLGLAEGWNIPCTGRAISPGDKVIELVAMPTDPGEEQDFAAWSALAVLTSSGLAELPPYALGLPLPWGGRTGMNDKVIERAIKDYLATHPHLSSLEIDIRAVSSSPRSREVDDAVLRFVGASSLGEVGNLGGSSRVWDSSQRLGAGPTRDSLFVQRGKVGREGPFEWRQYTPPEIPRDADIALIENPSVHLAITQGSAFGVTGPIPLRRFCPPSLEKGALDQNYSAEPGGDDLLGLSSLLAEIECEAGGARAALRASPLSQALGIGVGGRWEVLGAFNLDPLLLASVVAEQGQSAGKRLLWEWRPSWLGQRQKNDDELARRPYYVVARMPASLLNALEHRQAISSVHAHEMLADLGQRGIGMASLHATGGTHESAAAGFFYAMRLLLPKAGYGLPPAWIQYSEGVIYGLVPVDPIEPILEGLVGEPLERRADMLVVRLKRDDTGTHACFVPIEVKHHGSPGSPEPIPDDKNPELKRAREQLEQTAGLIDKIDGRISLIAGSNDAPGVYVRLLGLATLLDLAMSFSPQPPAAAEREAVLDDVLNGRMSVGLGDPVLLWFAPGSTQPGRAAISVDPHGTKTWKNKRLREIFIDPLVVKGLWWTGEATGPDEQYVRKEVDDVMTSSLSTCTTSVRNPAEGIREALAAHLGVSNVVSASISNVDEHEPPDEGRPGGEPADVVTGPTTEGSGESPAGQDIPSTPETGVVSMPATVQVDEGEGQAAVSGGNITSKKDDAVQSMVPMPRVFAGWTEPTSRWTLLGKLAGEDEPVGLDLDHPKAIGIFGYMGSGKSYLLGTIVEAAVGEIPGINKLRSPLATVIFNYRRNASDRFELSSLAMPNHDKADVERLSVNYGTIPQPARDVQVLALPGELSPSRLQEYEGIPATELYFAPSTLTVEDWELLMGEPGSDAVFARTIRHTLIELRSEGRVTLEELEDRVLNKLTKQSRTAAELRFDFVRHYISETRGVNFDQVIKPGRALIVDLRQPLFNKSDALRFFLVCANQISQVQGKFNKMIVFDEAHEYLSDEFGERIEARIRQMRHEGTSYVFATQDVGSIPLTIRRFITSRFVFNLGTRENVDDLLRFAPEFKGQQMQGMKAGYCLVQANLSTNNFFERPRLIHVRPRVTQHGGGSRIFSAGTQPEDTQQGRE